MSTGWRVFAGFLVAGIVVAAAVWIHSGWKSESYTAYRACLRSSNAFEKEARYLDPRCAFAAHRSAGWQDPLAAVVAFAGLGAGAALIVGAPRHP